MLRISHFKHARGLTRPYVVLTCLAQDKLIHTQAHMYTHPQKHTHKHTCTPMHKNTTYFTHTKTCTIYSTHTLLHNILSVCILPLSLSPPPLSLYLSPFYVTKHTEKQHFFFLSPLYITYFLSAYSLSLSLSLSISPLSM